MYKKAVTLWYWRTTWKLWGCRWQRGLLMPDNEETRLLAVLTECRLLSLPPGLRCCPARAGGISYQPRGELSLGLTFVTGNRHKTCRCRPPFWAGASGADCRGRERAAYVRAATKFLHWCAGKGLTS